MYVLGKFDSDLNHIKWKKKILDNLTQFKLQDRKRATCGQKNKQKILASKKKLAEIFKIFKIKVFAFPLDRSNANKLPCFDHVSTFCLIFDQVSIVS